MTAKFNGSGNRLFSVNYNARRMVTSMTVGNQPGYTTSFSYDANGYRIKKSNSSGAKIYLLEGEHIESVYDRDYNLQANYLRGAVVDEIINGFERNDDTGKMENRTFHHDQVNSVVAVSDHNGKAVQEHSYGPFGETFDSSGSSQNTMKYTGREQDDETGLYYYRARYYDPELGRFISEDPIGFKGGINFYAYVGNNPLIYNDPSGNNKQLQGSASFTLFWKLSRNSGYIGDVKFRGTPVGLGFGFSPGISLGDSIWDTQVYLDLRVSAFFDGTGAYVGVGGGGDITHSDGNLTVGAEEYESKRVEINAGLIESAGISAETDGDNNIIAGGGGKYGSGVGLMVGMGATKGVRYSTPTLGDSIDWVRDTWDREFGAVDASGASGGFVLYPSKINSNFNTHVYSK